ncbi:MAG: DUF1577 domain-containing protein [Spirochaetes bacterium]|nr:DUF1577 domain-containing protein [Spirochaetota bacterium]
MSLSNIVQRKNREFNDFGEVTDVVNILKSQFANRKLYVKYMVTRTEISIQEYLEDGTIMVVTDQDIEHEGNIIIFGLSDKYLEVDLEVIDEKAPGYFHCRIKSARKAISGRRDLRFKLEPDEVSATNFRVSKHTIDISSYNIPTSIKVVLDQFQSNSSKWSDLFKVDVFSTESKDYVLNMMRKTGKSLFISDISSRESYKSKSDDFINMFDVLGEELDNYIKKNIERGYRSIVAVPIIYITETANPVPFGYIKAISKSMNFDMDKVLELKDQSFKLVDRIRDANTHFIPVHQQIVDISRGGAKLKISDENLKKYLSRTRGFIFDVVFKLQAPITIYGDVKSTFLDEEKNLYVGVDFEGNSSRKDEMKRFYSILKPMEVEYKSRLMKSMKDRKNKS